MSVETEGGTRAAWKRTVVELQVGVPRLVLLAPDPQGPQHGGHVPVAVALAERRSRAGGGGGGVAGEVRGDDGGGRVVIPEGEAGQPLSCGVVCCCVGLGCAGWFGGTGRSRGVRVRVGRF